MNLLRRWIARGGVRDAPASTRWVVLDTETTGVDPDQDALLAIGAVAVEDDGIRAGDSFEVVIRHAGGIDAANVAVHGLGHAALDAGEAPFQALDAFRRWVDRAPCLAYHADFDRRVLDRAASLTGAAPLAGPWLDLAPLAASLHPEVWRKGTGALDDWLSAYEIACVSRHNAASDALAAAELLLRLRSAAAAQGSHGFDGLEALIRNRRWLGGRR